MLAGKIRCMTYRRFAFLAVCVVVVSLATAGLLVAQTPPHITDTQKIVMENMFARVIEVRVAAGVAEPLHSHARGVTVALTDYDNETRAPGGQWSKSHTKFGEVKWAEPVTHEARNVGATDQRVIRIELK